MKESFSSSKLCSFIAPLLGVGCGGMDNSNLVLTLKPNLRLSPKLFCIFLKHFSDFKATRPRSGLGRSSGGHSSHGYTSHASLRAFGARLGGDRLYFRRLTIFFEDNFFQIRGPPLSQNQDERAANGAPPEPKPGRTGCQQAPP